MIRATLLALLLASCEPALAHQAPTGWTYPANCCSDKDCSMMERGQVEEVREGYRVPSGEVIAHGDKRIKDSPDGRFHWCRLEGFEMGEHWIHTLCLFVPPPAS